MNYDPRDHYWIITGSNNRRWSSKARDFVLAADAGLAEWMERTGLKPTRIANIAELYDVLAQQAPDRLPDIPEAQDRRREYDLGTMDSIQWKVLYHHENRIRALEGKAAITAEQFRNGVKALF